MELTNLTKDLLDGFIKTSDNAMSWVFLAPGSFEPTQTIVVVKWIAGSPGFTWQYSIHDQTDGHSTWNVTNEHPRHVDFYKYDQHTTDHAMEVAKLALATYKEMDLKYGAGIGD